MESTRITAGAPGKQAESADFRHEQVANREGRGSCRAVCTLRFPRFHGSAGASPSRLRF